MVWTDEKAAASEMDWADGIALEILQPVDITADVANALRLQYARGRLDVVRRLREIADDSILSPAELPARAALLRACDILERETRKAGG